MLPSRDLLQTIVGIAREAGSEIMAVYEQGGDPGIETKGDDSPLTQADLRANKTIVSALRKCTPDVPVLSEESELPPYDVRKSWQTYWLVDPLDGTKEFISRNGEFTVNIALIHNGSPVLGVVHVPVTGVTYSGISGGNCPGTEDGAWKQGGPGQALTEIRSHVLPADIDWAAQTLRIVASRRHGSEQLERLLEDLRSQVSSVEQLNIGSSLKICLIAEGQADLYPRFGPTSEWDTAAAHAILRGAGGEVMTMSFEPLSYNQRETLLNPEFMALGAGDEFVWRQLLAASIAEITKSSEPSQ